MKKYLFFLLVSALVACTNTNDVEIATFKKGQKVTLAVGAYTSSNTTNLSASRKSDGYVRGVMDPVTHQMRDGVVGNIDFQWNQGDHLKVFLGDDYEHAEDFTMDESRSQYGTDENYKFGGVAYFDGNMPGEGKEFSIGTGKKTMSSYQKYHYDGIDKDIMYFEKKGCTLNGGTIVLEPQYSAIRFKYAVSCGWPSGGIQGYNQSDLELHSAAGKLYFKAYKKLEDSNASFQCTYDFEGRAISSTSYTDGAYLYAVIVFPPGEYELFTIQADPQSECYATNNNGDIVAKGRQDNPKEFRMNFTVQLSAFGKKLVIGGGEYFDAGLMESTYTYQAVSQPTN